MTIHDLVARDEIGTASEIEMARKPSPWGVVAVILGTMGFWAYIFALAHAVF